MNGSPWMSSRAFGMRWVKGRNRVASPPARMAMERVFASCHVYEPGPLEIEAETYFFQAGWRIACRSSLRPPRRT